MKDCHIKDIPPEFHGQTTYSDYVWHEYRRPKLFTPIRKADKPIKKLPPHRLRDVESYSYWRDDVYVPFNFYFRPKDIIQTNPYASFALKEKGDSKDEEVRQTKPRVYMAPAISMDDIEDVDMRKLFCRRMYTTEFRNAEREAAPLYCERIPPNTTHENCADPVKYKPSKVDILDLEIYDDEGPTKTGRRVCDQDPFKDVIPQSLKNEIAHLISKNELRLPHDYPKPGYTGYRPILAKGVSLPKRDFPTVHPNLSVAQAIASRWKDDS